jgi:hypothetical protein
MLEFYGYLVRTYNISFYFACLYQGSIPGRGKKCFL